MTTPGPSSENPLTAREIVVRPLRGSDIESVSRIERQSFTIPWSTQAYVTEIANPNAVYLVATPPQTDPNVTPPVIGYGGLWVIMDEAHITTIAVDPTYRGLKLGERILGDMIIASQRKGATRATLEVRETNDTARNLYEKYGFEWVAIRKGYYSDNQENAVIMWINDMETPEWRQRFQQNRAALGLTTK